MRTIISWWVRLLPVATLAPVPAGCGGPSTPPEGFRLAIQMQDVSVAIIDELRVTITPRAEATMPRFQDIEPTTYEGGIVVDVDDMGVLSILVPGDVVRANTTGTDEFMPRFVLKMWSDDAVMRMGPQVRATVVRDGEQVATGAGFLPQWPLALGSETQINVPCRMGYETRCRP